MLAAAAPLINLSFIQNLRQYHDPPGSGGLFSVGIVRRRSGPFGPLSLVVLATRHCACRAALLT